MIKLGCLQARWSQHCHAGLSQICSWKIQHIITEQFYSVVGIKVKVGDLIPEISRCLKTDNNHQQDDKMKKQRK